MKFNEMKYRSWLVGTHVGEHSEEKADLAEQTELFLADMPKE